MNRTTWHACTHALLSETKICSSRECDSIFGCDYILIPVRLKFVFAHLAISLNTALGFIFCFVLHLAGIHALSVVGSFTKCDEYVSFVSQRSAEINECGCQFVALIMAPKKRKRFIVWFFRNDFILIGIGILYDVGMVFGIPQYELATGIHVPCLDRGCVYPLTVSEI